VSRLPPATLASVVSVLLGCAIATAPPSAAQTMDAIVRNALLVEFPSDYPPTKYVYDSAGTFTSPGGHMGKWALVNDELCIEAAEGQSCSPLAPGMDLGDKWAMTAINGERITVSIVHR